MEQFVYHTDMTAGAQIGGDPSTHLCALTRTLLNDLRSPVATIRLGAELLTRTDLSTLQSQRLARNVLVAVARVEEILSDLSLQLADAGSH